MGGWTYILRCSDDSYYVGSTSYADVEARVTEHNDAKYIGYTSSRRPVVLVWAMGFDDLRDAHEAERRIKGWGRGKKEALIAGNERALKALAIRRAGRTACQAAKQSRPLIAAEPRHPEVRAQRAPKDAR